ncbi:MAG: hypothetical protein ACD_16C00043G0006 [uncultured bacterium]|nr:MAG: hypothetical protein ACD_16C00043G0006 [uncultured bacterium]OFW68405.1 MAG: hypothetical protein A2X70_06870 [Alphaproteobacteria bacterium GWC2_42_16]OFW73039.1 MAG: hypothetical protein A2Z80_07365 [Alphaproteobacteria bacterium GWA2_41_27]OFW81497.1 MAG: hypothetical protein A3E50_05840 [Alphaproteobacteria bacterium RIFCSPHIGHO2_12_FULL_42_100]OFW85244.1 MAG: hypothetical protein A2W06_07505 [Alphaproteobacteria bacterium RBG_16_42_14]OFW91079.1 MAG: hypothetical protein A2W46_056
MRLTLRTPVSQEPFSLDEVKRFLRITSDQEENLLQHLLYSARAYVEDMTGRALLKQQWLLEMKPPYPRASPLVRQREGHIEIMLPRPPLLKIVSVEVQGKAISHDSEENRVILAPSFWNQSLSILYWAGYGEEAQSLPPTLKHAILIVLAAFYDHQKVDTSLLTPFRVHHLI